MVYGYVIFNMYLMQTEPQSFIGNNLK